MAAAGSIRAARNAGIQHATTPIAAIITATPMNEPGSWGATPKSSPSWAAPMGYQYNSTVATGIRKGGSTSVASFHVHSETEGGRHVGHPPAELHMHPTGKQEREGAMQRDFDSCAERKDEAGPG